MKNIRVFLSLTCLLSWLVNAADPFELEHGEQPNHLVPVGQNTDKYYNIVQKKLLPTSGDYGRMIYFPSFRGEFAVSVYEYESTDSANKVSQQFRITLTKATRSIWYSTPENNDEKQQKPVEIKRSDTIIDKAFSVAIQRAWAAMLLQTRYPSKSYVGCDGSTAEFSVWVRGAGVLRGEIWSPKLDVNLRHGRQRTAARPRQPAAKKTGPPQRWPGSPFCRLLCGRGLPMLPPR